MKKLNIIAFLLALVSPLIILSCSEENDEVNEFANWQNRNNDYFLDIYQKASDNTDGSWKIIRNYSLEDSINVEYYDHIAVQVLEEGTGSGCPMYTDSVMVNYRGRLMPSESYPEGYVFDENYKGEYNPMTARPAKFVVGDLVDGFTTALQYMHIGDRWRVYIPYQLGYKTADNGSIPAYSTLVFDIALMSYYRAGTPTDPYKSKKHAWVKE